MYFNLKSDMEYKRWLYELKHKIRNVQIKAALKANTELLNLYWEIGADIVAKQEKSKWGERFLLQLSKDLIEEFPDMKGFSERNLKYIRQWYSFYSFSNPENGEIGQQVVAQIAQIPWGHNIAIISRCKDKKEAIYYVRNTLLYNWSRSVLVHHIESHLYEREGKAVTNFTSTLPKPQSDLAVQTLKDPYIFDFLSMTKDYSEHDLEKVLVDHITHFLLELGAGFAYIGRQVELKVGESVFYLDLLFYHVKLRCYVVIELKCSDFEPSHAGKLNFYLTAVDKQLRTEYDNPTVGIVICKTKDKVVAEYALTDINKPIGISEYAFTQLLPENYKGSLPSIEEIELEIGGLNE